LVPSFFRNSLQTFFDIETSTALLNVYMNPSPRQAGSSPMESEYPDRNSTPSVSSVHKYPQNEWSHNMIDIPHGLGALQSPSDPLDQLHRSTNDAGQYQDLRGNDHELFRGMGNYAVQSSLGTQTMEVASFSHGTSCPYNLIMLPQSVEVTPPIPMEHATPPYQPVMLRQTKYDPFQNLFHTSDHARDHRRRATRFDRMPYCDPESDYTIVDIENNRLHNIMRIYNAMTSGGRAKDNRGSIAMKRWVLDAHYPPDLVEAYAHKVFDCLLAQTKEGFRGWVYNDYVADERKGDDIDKDVDCAGRLDNIIHALEQEKTICEDVMNSACQIRMFVNAPRAYANRKHQNRVGNSKRGRTKDTPDANPKSAKMQKRGSRRTRARSTTASDLPSSRDTTPQQQSISRSIPPYYSSPSQPQSSRSPQPGVTIYSDTQSLPLHGSSLSVPLHSFGLRSVVAMSPPTSSPRTPLAPQSYTPRMTTEPLHYQSPFDNKAYSASASPDDTKPPAMGTSRNIWQYDSGFGQTSYTSHATGGEVIDPALYPLDFTKLRPSDQYPEKFVNLSEIELPHTEHRSGDANPSPFGDFWESCIDSGTQNLGFQ
jgi:hypothetical protein